jgi:hypothetical protein
MALFDKNNSKILLSFIAGAATGAFATKFAPAIAEAAKPALKAAVKVALLGAEASREFVAHAKEALEDATAEAQAELTQVHATPSAATASNDFTAQTAPKGVGSA